MEISRAKQEHIIQKACHDEECSGQVLRLWPALREMQAHKQRLKQTQDVLCENIAQAFENDPELNLDKVQKHSANRLNADIESFNWVRAKLRTLEAQNAIKPSRDYPYAISTQKMPEIFMGAQQILSDESSLQRILNGKYPFSYQNDDVAAVTLLGDTDSNYGTSKTSFISAALLNCYLSISGQAHMSASNNHAQSFIDVDMSPILHSGWLPPSLDWTALAQVKPQIEHFS